MANLASKPGLTSASVAISIPKDWSSEWFKSLVSNLLQGADVRNAVGANGITVSGNIASPYATIGFTPPLVIPNITAVTVAFNFGTNYFSTGAAAPVLTANKPGASTAILGWLKIQLNGTTGWVPVWAN